MARFFPTKKDPSTERGHVDTTAVKKNKFNLFRRGRSEMPETVPEPERVTTQRKTQSYRISVYEVRSESPATTCSSTDSSDVAQRDATPAYSRARSKTRRRRSPSPKGRRGLAASPLKHIRSKSPSKSIRTDVCVEPDSVRPEPQRTFSQASGDRSADRPSPIRGILKRATYSLLPEKRAPAVVKKPTPIASFDLEFARATSLTDNMSVDPDEVAPQNAQKNESFALGTRNDSFVIHPKRTVSFSKDVRDPKPKPSGVASLCLGTRSGRRMVR